LIEGATRLRIDSNAAKTHVRNMTRKPDLKDAPLVELLQEHFSLFRAARLIQNFDNAKARDNLVQYAIREGGRGTSVKKEEFKYPDLCANLIVFWGQYWN
jgi:hypothetical protein